MALTIDKRINNTLLLSLGGNVGDVRKVFAKAINGIESELGEVLKQSSIYKTAAWGVENQPDFLNQVLIVETKLKPLDCLTKVLKLEHDLGRVRSGKKWEERVIDIDILFYDEKVIDLPNLKVPHPFLHERNFILIPLVEIYSDFVHPQLNKTILELKKMCFDDLEVIKDV
jgi:2-amino-4-hydroxy-6-hydroxymethyldihydropteridine diphosphokinase